MERIGIGRIRAGAHSDDYFVHFDFFGHTAGRADADYGFHAEEVEQLIAVYADGGHSHAACHNGNRHAVKSSRVSVYAADIVYKFRIFKIVFRNKLCPKRIAGHKHGFCKILRHCVNMWGRVWFVHIFSSLFFLRRNALFPAFVAHCYVSVVAADANLVA